MGTSTNYNAPTSPQWKNLKTKVTKLARQGKLSPSNIRKILQDFVAANYYPSGRTSGSGGTGQARAAQAVAQKIGGFFSLVDDIGFHEALKRVGLGSLEGKSLDEIALLLLDYLGGPSSTLDQTDARAALSDLMEEFLDDADTPEDIEEVMETISHGESLDSFIQNFFGYYIYQQFCRAFYNRLVDKIGDRQADESIGDIRDYICGTLKDVISDRDVGQIDWHGSQGQQIVEEILRKTLEVFSE